MDWKEVVYRDWVISVGRNQRSGKWIASYSALPQGGTMAVAGSGKGRAVPGEFASEEAALNAAKRYIDDQTR